MEFERLRMGNLIKESSLSSIAETRITLLDDSAYLLGHTADERLNAINTQATNLLNFGFEVQCH